MGRKEFKPPNSEGNWGSSVRKFPERVPAIGSYLNPRFGLEKEDLPSLFKKKGFIPFLAPGGKGSQFPYGISFYRATMTSLE